MRGRSAAVRSPAGVAAGSVAGRPDRISLSGRIFQGLAMKIDDILKVSPVIPVLSFRAVDEAVSVCRCL